VGDLVLLALALLGAGAAAWRTHALRAAEEREERDLHDWNEEEGPFWARLREDGGEACPDS
jgi:hypothetical protein